MQSIPLFATGGKALQRYAQATAIPDKRRKQLYQLLGDLPALDRPIAAKTIFVQERAAYTLEKLTLDLNGFEPVPAYFVRPKSVSNKLPTVLYNHWHGGEYQVGKEEILLERFGLPAYADVLTRLGYCALCMDTWAFGERSSNTEMDIFKAMLWRGQVMWGMMVYDSLRGIDYLVSRPEVDPSRIATLGMSMGSTMAWWVAALDPRLKVCVDICCLTDFQALIEAKNLRAHGIYYYVPSLLKYFTTAQISGLIAPRAHLAVEGNLDELTPPAGLDRIDLELKDLYRRLGKAEQWKLVRYNIGHTQTPEMRQEIVAFLLQHL
jgi:hypothetical protein